MGSALLMWQEKPAASTKKQDVLQDEETLFKANSPIKQEFLNSPISSAFHCIKSLTLYFSSSLEKGSLVAFSCCSSQQSQNLGGGKEPLEIIQSNPHCSGRVSYSRLLSTVSS